jgi:hypothetical protein
MAFKVPLQSEVQAYIKEKKGWPDKFCQHYADKFWNYYNSNGWKVGNKAPMKDWKSAFNAQWQVLKFKDDIDFLNACLRSQQEVPRGATAAPAPVQEQGTLMYIDEILAYYEKNWEQVEEVRLASCYDWLKENRLMRISREEGALAKQTCNGNEMKGKAICVKMLFDKMITRGMTFKQLAGGR